MTTTTETFYQKNCESFLYSSANSLFTERDSIWTYNCPCPSPRHRDDIRHICRFKEQAASSVIYDQSVDQLLQEEFESLASSFSQRSLSVMVVSPPEIVAETTTVVDPPPPQYTKYSEFMDFMALNQIVVRARQCYYTDGCHTKGCTFGHSIEEMADLFKDQRVCQFYKEASLKKTAYMPSSKKEMTLNPLPKSKCSSVKCKDSDTTLSLRLILYTGYDTYLIAPYITLKCPNCLRIHNVPIYK